MDLMLNYLPPAGSRVATATVSSIGSGSTQLVVWTKQSPPRSYDIRVRERGAMREAAGQ